jgi:hypothetical protein
VSTVYFFREDIDDACLMSTSGYNVKVDSKYTPWVKLGLAALTAAGLLGGAHQAGVVDVFPLAPSTFRFNLRSPTVLLS